MQQDIGTNEPNQVAKCIRLIGIEIVMRETSLARSTIYSLVKQGRFPKPVKLATRSSKFVEAEVQDWIKARIEDSRPQGINTKPTNATAQQKQGAA